MQKGFKRNTNGFTLIEMIVVLVIIALLAAIILPSFGAYVDSAKAKECATNRRALMLRLNSAMAGDPSRQWTVDMLNGYYATDAELKEITCPSGGTYIVKPTAPGSSTYDIACNKLDHEDVGSFGDDYVAEGKLDLNPDAAPSAPAPPVGSTDEEQEETHPPVIDETNPPETDDETEPSTDRPDMTLPIPDGSGKEFVLAGSYFAEVDRIQKEIGTSGRDGAMKTGIYFIEKEDGTRDYYFVDHTASTRVDINTSMTVVRPEDMHFFKLILPPSGNVFDDCMEPNGNGGFRWSIKIEQGTIVEYDGEYFVYIHTWERGQYEGVDPATIKMNLDSDKNKDTQNPNNGPQFWYKLPIVDGKMI